MIQLWGFAIFVFIASTTLSANGQPPPNAEFQKMMEENVKACQASEKASDADVAAFHGRQVPTTLQGKCFVGCVFQRMGILTPSGSFNKDLADQKTKAFEHPEYLARALKQNALCEKEVGTGSDKCVAGPLLMTCGEI